MKLAYKLGLLCLLVGTLCSSASAQLLRTVTLSGDPAPGTSSGVIFDSFSGAPALNSVGQVAFFGHLADAGVGGPIGEGIWSGVPSSLTLVVRTGSHAPGTPGGVTFLGVINGTTSPVLNSSGQTVFYGRLSTNSEGIWSEGAGPLGLVARRGENAPGTSNGEEYSSLASPVLNSSGKSAFLAGLTGIGVDDMNDVGIWSEGAGSLGLVARKGTQAPDVANGVLFSGLESPVLNSAGQTAFLGFLGGNGVDNTNYIGIWSEGSGSLKLVARQGEDAADMPPGVLFGGLLNPVLNSAGQIAFKANLTGGGLNTANGGIWSGVDGNLSLVALAGDPAPGTTSGVNYFAFAKPALNSAGQVAFLGFLTGIGVATNERGIWSEGFGPLGLVAREGDQAPGTPSGVSFGSLRSPALNSAGQTAFITSLTGSGIDSTNDLGIWAEDRSGLLRLIAREGEPLEVESGEFRTISRLNFQQGTGNDDGHASGFNDLGQLTFKATFIDGTSGIFISNLATLPEPSSLLLVATAIVALLLKTQRS